MSLAKILIIEDELNVRENIQEMLEMSEFETVTAENGLIGLQLAQSQKPDLIICDVMMPKMDGYAVVTALRQNPATKDIPVIFLTAKATRADMRQGMNLGADDYLTKPFTLEELLAAVTTRLQRQQSTVQQAAKVRQLLAELQASQENQQHSEEFAILATELFQQLAEDLRNPLSNINLAIRMLEQATSQQSRDRYLTILKSECDREIELLNKVTQLQQLLTPENAQILQRFNLLNTRQPKSSEL
jgi:two-component system alkaline phosphatase synthesis response regulator PhoP